MKKSIIFDIPNILIKLFENETRDGVGLSNVGEKLNNENAQDLKKATNFGYFVKSMKIKSLLSTNFSINLSNKTDLKENVMLTYIENFIQYSSEVIQLFLLYLRIMGVSCYCLIHLGFFLFLILSFFHICYFYIMLF